MINYPKPSQLISAYDLKKNQLKIFLYSKFGLYKQHQIYWRVQLIAVKDVLMQFCLSKQSNKIIRDIENKEINNLENSVSWSFVTVPFLMIIWMYFFYSWPAYHPELFAIAVGFPLCFISIRLIQFVRKRVPQ